MSRIEHALVRPQFVPPRRVESIARVPAALRHRGSPAAVDVFEAGRPRSWMEQVAVSNAPLTPQPPGGWFRQGEGNACGTTALSYVLLAATLLLSLIQFRFFGRREKDIA